MRGDERVQDGMFSYVSLEQRLPQDHPLRAVRKLTDAVLRALSREFDALYADSGRPSIAPYPSEQIHTFRGGDRMLKLRHAGYESGC
jgi:transposase